MPTIITSAVHSARGFGFGGGQGVAVYVKGQTFSLPNVSGGGSFNISFSGVSQGDVALVMVTQLSASTPSGWTLLDSFLWGVNYPQQLFFKRVDAADILAGSVNFSYANSGNTGGNAQAMFYTNASSASVASTGTSTSTTLSIPGFVRTQASRGIVTFAVTRDPPATGMAPPVIATLRIPSFASTFYAMAGADIIPPFLYTNGAALVWTGFAGTTYNAGQAIELF